MKIINKTEDKERAFFGSENVEFENIKIDGPADGESAFKECKNISISNSCFNLRYPMWHDVGLKVNKCELTDACRAALWYSKNIVLTGVISKGIKALRECENVSFSDSNFVSDEIFWRVKNINIENSKIEGAYAFFESKHINISKLDFKGKYSFQYVKNAIIKDSILDTKDAFWHSKGITCINCVIKGEYLGWYSNQLTLVNCKISGTQPLCYAKNLKIVDCTFENCDLAFEYSSVKGNIVGDVISIKNPLKGFLKVSGNIDYIHDENDRSCGRFKLLK